MNKTTAITGGVIVLAVIGGLIFYVATNTSPSSNNATPTTSTNTTSSTAQTQTQEPGAPVVTTSATAAQTDTTVVITGSVIPNGAFTNYWFEYGLTTNLGYQTNHQLVGSGYVAIGAPAYITGLTKNTKYYFRLVAENLYSRVSGNSYSFQTTNINNPPPVGSAPATKTLDATGISKTTANLNGEVNPNRASTQHWFEYGKTPNLGNTTSFVSIGDGNVNVPASISLSDLDPQTTYYFRLNAQNQFGTVNGAILNFKTTGSPASTAPSATTKSATSIGISTATLRGAVNPNGADTTYWFEYYVSTPLTPIVIRRTDRISTGAGINASAVSADVSGLTSNTDYAFRLAAENSRGTVHGEYMTFTTKNK